MVAKCTLGTNRACWWTNRRWLLWQTGGPSSRLVRFLEKRAVCPCHRSGRRRSVAMATTGCSFCDQELCPVCLKVSTCRSSAAGSIVADNLTQNRLLLFSASFSVYCLEPQVYRCRDDQNGRTAALYISVPWSIFCVLSQPGHCDRGSLKRTWSEARSLNIRHGQKIAAWRRCILYEWDEGRWWKVCEHFCVQEQQSCWETFTTNGLTISHLLLPWTHFHHPNRWSSGGVSRSVDRSGTNVIILPWMCFITRRIFFACARGLHCI